MRADLHLHSRFSDGGDTVEEVIAKAKARGLDAISFVDHDTTDTYDYIKENDLAKDEDLVIIPGIEISAYDFKRDTKVHILGYNYDSEALHIKALCSDLSARRHALSIKQLEVIQEAGYPIDEESVNYALTSPPVLYKQYIIEALVDEPYWEPRYQRLNKHLFKGGGIVNQSIEYIDAYAAVKAIKADNGLAVLAHPGQFDNYNLVPQLAEIGLDGIERHHPDHKAKDYEKVDWLSREYNLFKTGGSDYHGKFWTSPYPGFNQSPQDGQKVIDDYYRKFSQQYIVKKENI